MNKKKKNAINGQASKFRETQSGAVADCMYSEVSFTKGQMSEQNFCLLRILRREECQVLQRTANCPINTMEDFFYVNGARKN